MNRSLFFLASLIFCSTVYSQKKECDLSLSYFDDTEVRIIPREDLVSKLKIKGYKVINPKSESLDYGASHLLDIRVYDGAFIFPLISNPLTDHFYFSYVNQIEDGESFSTEKTFFKAKSPLKYFEKAMEQLPDCK